MDQVNQGLNEAKNTLPRLAQQMPAMKPLAEFVTSIQCEADGNKASLTSAFQGEAASLFIMPMMFGAGQAQPIPPQPVAPPPLPPVQPANK